MANNIQRQKVSPDTWIKLGIYVAGGLGVAYGVKKILDFLKPEKKRNESEVKQIETELEAEKKKKAASYPPSQYASWASSIAEAIFGFGTYNDVIINIFKQLKNNTDFLMLQKAWGNPTRQIYPDGFVFYSTGKKLTLSAALRDDMATEYIKLINKILASKGITYRI
jgi:hypothetical protein